MYPFFKKLRAISLDRLKKYVEIFAILAAGLFAFFTWGLDYLVVSRPNWETSITKTLHLKAVDTNNVNLLIGGDNASKDYIGDSATSCVYYGTLMIKNNGTRPLYLRKTKIEVFILERIKSHDTSENSGIVDASLFRYYEKIDSSSKDPVLTIFLNEIDSLPVFPGNLGMRPFSFEVNPKNIKGIGLSLREFSKNYIYFILGNQTIETKGIINNRRYYSKAAKIESNICSLRSIEFQEPRIIKPKKQSKNLEK